jgi:hypothetical protein
MEQRAQILGGICIFDLGGITLQHAWQITPTIARMAVELLVVSYSRITFHVAYDYKLCNLYNPNKRYPKSNVCLNVADNNTFIVRASLWLFSFISRTLGTHDFSEAGSTPRHQLEEGIRSI